MIVQLLRAPNDSNGNPRRVWVAYDPEVGNVVAVADEGYVGFPPEWNPRSAHVEIANVEVSAKEYRAFLHLGKVVRP